jgi:hypothetical protein
MGRMWFGMRLPMRWWATRAQTTFSCRMLRHWRPQVERDGKDQVDK